MSDVAVPTSTRSWPRAAVLLPGLALLGFVLAVGWYGRAHGNLGMPWAPFFLYPHTRISWWAVPGLLAVVGSVAAAPRVFSVRSVRGFMAASFALALVARLGVNVIRSGPHGFIAPFVGFEGGQEYLTTVKRVTHDPLVFLRHFAHLVPNLPTHSAGHPPGPSLIAILLNDAGLGGPWPLAVLVIAVGTLAVPLTYLLGGALGLEDGAARLAALMAALAPAAVIESVTSMDAVFATLAVGTLVVILRGRYWLGGALVWLCSFMSYALAAVPMWAVLVIWRQRSLREAVRMTVRVAAVTIALTLVARYAFGYNLIGAFQATNHRYLYGPGSDAMHRPESFWLFGDIAAFLFGLGVPVVLGLGVALVRRSPEAWALAAVVLLAAAGGYTKGEVERIWLFLIPLAALAAAPCLPRFRAAIAVGAGILLVQAVMIATFASTTW